MPDEISQFNQILKPVAEISLVPSLRKTRKKDQKTNHGMIIVVLQTVNERAVETCEKNSESHSSSIIATRIFCSQKEIQKVGKKDA